MVLPRLIHPVPTFIQPVLVADTFQDDDYNEPIQAVRYGETYAIPGQWNWFTDRELRAQQYGSEEGSIAYVMVRRYDLHLLGKIVSRGDRVIAYGAGYNKIDLDLYVTKLRYEGHYPDQGGPALMKVFVNDRQPTRQTRGA